MSTEPPFSTRREFLASTASGVGAIALAHLLRQDGALADVAKKPGENLSLDLRARAPHFAPRAQAMISLFMHGGPSHVDLLDPEAGVVETKRHRVRRRRRVQFRQSCEQEALRHSLEVRPDTASAAPRSRNYCPRRLASSTTSA